MLVFCSTLIDSFITKIRVHKLQFIVKYGEVFTAKWKKKVVLKAIVFLFYNVGNE